MPALNDMNTSDSHAVRSRDVFSLTKCSTVSENVQVTVIGIFGPTASGKSGVAESIADEVRGELVSADAMQVYRGLPILTNQSPGPRSSGSGRWTRRRRSASTRRWRMRRSTERSAAGRTPIVVGGTGLYLRAALAEPRAAAAAARRAPVSAGRPPTTPTRPPRTTSSRELDPTAAAAVHANDRRRVVRALELAEAGASLAPDADALWSEATRHPTVIVGLDSRRTTSSGASRSARARCSTRG